MFTFSKKRVYEKESERASERASERERSHRREKDLNLLSFPLKKKKTKNKNKSMFTLNKAASVRLSDRKSVV